MHFLAVIDADQVFLGIEDIEQQAIVDGDLVRWSIERHVAGDPGGVLLRLKVVEGKVDDLPIEDETGFGLQIDHDGRLRLLLLPVVDHRDGATRVLAQGVFEVIAKDAKAHRERTRLIADFLQAEVEGVSRRSHTDEQEAR